MFSNMNKPDLKSLNNQTLFNIISMIIRGGISYLTMPIFTRLLGSEQYGMFSIYLSWSGIFACFMGLQCGSSLATRYYKYDDYKEYKTSLFSFCLLTCFSIIIIVLFFINQVESFMELPKVIVIMMLFDSATTCILSYANSGWIYEKKAQKNMLVAITNAVLSVNLSIFLIHTWKSESLYVARAVGNFIPALLIAVIICIDIFKTGNFKLNNEYIRYGLHFGIPILFHMLSQYVLAQSDRLMMQKMDISQTDIGIYCFAYNFSMILSTILLALGNGWTPYLYDGLKRKKYKETYKSLINYVKLFTIFCCGFLLVSKEIGELFGSKEFWTGLNLIPIFVLAVYCIFIYQFAVSYETFMEQPKYVAIMTIFAAAINIVLNWFMIPQMGIYGAALATLISYFFLAIFHFLIIDIWEYEKYPFKNSSLFIGAIVVIITAVLFNILYDFWLIRWIFAGTLGVYLICDVEKRRSIF